MVLVKTDLLPHLISKVPLHLRSNWDSFYLELLLLTGLLIYFTNFSFGRTKNARLAAAWFDTHKSFLLQQFALVGKNFFPQLFPVMGLC